MFRFCPNAKFANFSYRPIFVDLQYSFSHHILEQARNQQHESREKERGKQSWEEDTQSGEEGRGKQAASKEKTREKLKEWS